VRKKEGSKMESLIAEIALYGRAGAAAAIICWKEGSESKTEGIGYGGQFGEELKLGGLTEALFAGCAALKAKGISGRAAVHLQMGETGKMAFIEISNPPYVGNLKWEAGPVYTISGEELAKHAKQG
jgi:hypothetical protein